jgi:hypothetical protein
MSRFANEIDSRGAKQKNDLAGRRLKAGLHVKRIGTLAVGIAVMAVAAAYSSQTADRQSQAAVSARFAEAPEKIYSDDPNDSWNRIFYYLFSRRVTARLSSDFPEAAPFEKVTDLEFLRVERSTRAFERNESGDRAIDPLYPSFLTDDGIRLVLRDPAYADLKQALEDGLADTAPRDSMARAMMQSDLWAAYDIVFRCKYFEQRGERELAQRRMEILDLVGRLIRKVALTPEEIRSLPDNYSMARTKYGLPDLFGKTGWVEIKWFPHRLHDESSGYRRVTRVFLKPARVPKDMQKFLNDFRGANYEAIQGLQGVALVMQPLLVDTHGHVEPTTVTTDVQIRMFRKTKQGVFEKTQVGEYEVSRRLLREAASGFLAQEGEDEPVYLPAAGNDYSYASPNRISGGLPLVVKQRTRCAMCHGDKLELTGLMTFAMTLPSKNDLGPPVRQLNPAGHEAADFVISQKMGRVDWKSLSKQLQ